MDGGIRKRDCYLAYLTINSNVWPINIFSVQNLWAEVHSGLGLVQRGLHLHRRAVRMSGGLGLGRLGDDLLCKYFSHLIIVFLSPHNCKYFSHLTIVETIPRNQFWVKQRSRSLLSSASLPLSWQSVLSNSSWKSSSVNPTQHDPNSLPQHPIDLTKSYVSESASMCPIYIHIYSYILYIIYSYLLRRN